MRIGAFFQFTNGTIGSRIDILDPLIFTAVRSDPKDQQMPLMNFLLLLGIGLVPLHIPSAGHTSECRLSLRPDGHACQRCKLLAVVAHAGFATNEAVYLIYILVVCCS